MTPLQPGSYRYKKRDGPDRVMTEKDVKLGAVASDQILKYPQSTAKFEGRMKTRKLRIQISEKGVKSSKLTEVDTDAND